MSTPAFDVIRHASKITSPHWLYRDTAARRRGAASAATDNGGSCAFPWSACASAYKQDCLHVSNVSSSGQAYTFTLASTCDPLGPDCAQDLAKVVFSTCESRRLT